MIHSENLNGNLVKKVILSDEQATMDFADQLAQSLAAQLLENSEQPGLVVYLNGDLGSGKTSLSRHFVQHFLPVAKVKSPTYTLVESYQTANFAIHHFDLYRLCDPEELEFLAVRDLLTPPFVALVEWPNQGAGFLPPADLQLNWQFLEQGRALEIVAISEFAKNIFKKMFA